MKKIFAISAFVLLSVVTGNVAYAAMPLTADVKVGSQGEKVFMLQDFLRAEGHFNRASTGYFGPITASALQGYQTANGLTASGVLDDATLVSIQDEATSAEAVVDAAMDRHPEKVPNLIEAVKNILTDIDPADEGSASKIAQLSWLLSALLK